MYRKVSSHGRFQSRGPCLKGTFMAFAERWVRSNATAVPVMMTWPVSLRMGIYFDGYMDLVKK